MKKLESIILGTGNIIEHIASAGLAVDSVFNLYNGNYELAAFEGIASVYIQISKYFHRKEQKNINEFSRWVKKYVVPETQSLTKDTNSRFNNLFAKMYGCYK